MAYECAAKRYGGALLAAAVPAGLGPAALAAAHRWHVTLEHVADSSRLQCMSRAPGTTLDGPLPWTTWRDLRLTCPWQLSKFGCWKGGHEVLAAWAGE